MNEVRLTLDNSLYEALIKAAKKDNMDLDEFIISELEYYYG